jgi:hypothetical protein
MDQRILEIIAPPIALGALVFYNEVIFALSNFNVRHSRPFVNPMRRNAAKALDNLSIPL